MFYFFLNTTMESYSIKQFTGNNMQSRKLYHSDKPFKSMFNLVPLSATSMAQNEITAENPFKTLLEMYSDSPKQQIHFDEAPEQPQLNPALQIIGLNVLKQYFLKIRSISNDLIISIGSGNGYIERHIEKELETTILCVDPMRIESVQDMYKASNFNYINDLLEDYPNLINNSITFINWSFPNDSTYDYDALAKLSSDNVLIVCETTGSGGGKVLLTWLDYCGLTTDNSFTENDVILHNFPKYYVVKSTLSRVDKPPLGQFEYAIVWLSKNPIEIDCTDISNYIGNLIPRRKFDPFESMLDTLLMGFSKMSGFTNNNLSFIHEDINKERYEREIEKEQFLKYGGYHPPHNPLNETDMLELKNAILNSAVGDTIECHHPYYRNILSEFAKSNNIELISFVNQKIRKDEDSMLLYHYGCKKCTPVSHISWYPDYSYLHPGTIYQMEATCKHCDGCIFTNCKNDREDKNGYKYVRGKNCLKVISK